jgi:hypothetical protein
MLYFNSITYKAKEQKRGQEKTRTRIFSNPNTTKILEKSWLVVMFRSNFDSRDQSDEP